MSSSRIPGVIYVRQSVTKDGSESRETQVEVCTEAAPRLGIEVIATIIEPPSTSGYKNRGRSRPKFREVLLPMLASGEAQAILVYKSERLSRGGGPGWAPIWDAYEQGGGDNHDRFVATPNGWMTELEIGIRASMDREEAKKMSQRTTDNHARAAQAGKPRHGGLRPFGYEADLVTVCEPEAALIREAAGRVHRGESAWGVARDWNTRGIKTSTGNHWGSQTLKRLLRSGRIAGYREVKGEIVAKAVWPAILDEAIWNEVRGLLDRHPSNGRTAAGGGRARSFLLNGFVYCGRCGSRMQSRTRNGSRREYTCQSPESSGQADSCNRCVIHADPVEDYVFETGVLGLVLDPKWREMVARSMPRDTDDHGDIMGEMAELDRRRERLNEIYLDGNMSKTEYQRRSERLKDERSAMLGKLSTRTELKLLASIPTDEGAFRAMWEERGLDWQRLVLDVCLESVSIRPGRAARPADRVDLIPRSWEGQPTRIDAPATRRLVRRADRGQGEARVSA